MARPQRSVHFVLTLLVAGTPLRVMGEVQSHGKANTLASTGFFILIVALLVPLGRYLCRLFYRSYREIMDCIWVAQRGVLNPIQVRQEFIETMGREPTIAEVHDLHQLIESEYRQAMQRLVIFAGIVLGSSWLFRRTAHHSSPATPLSNVTSLQGRR